MRIIAGRWKGRKLEAPLGDRTRPTGDRAREAIFSMLASRLGSFEELRVADLFAGTGALGLEALSRGAAHCTFAESDNGALSILRRNIEACGAEADIIAADVRALPAARRACDLVFMDPPYASGLHEPALAVLAERNWLAPGGWVIVETAAAIGVEAPGLARETDRRFGKARITLLRNP